MGTTAPPAGTRRERAREATTAEIKSTARDLLVRSGPEAVTLRAIAREMGMSAPALYRYFASHEQLVAAVAEEVLAEITSVLEAARDAAGEDPVERLLAACRAFRRWSLEHLREFQLVFASAGGPPRLERSPEECLGDLAFGAVFLGIFVEIWQQRPFRAPSESDLPAPLVTQLREFSSVVGDVLPLGVLAAWLAGWVRLYGAVTIEVFGHLGFALVDPEPMFEAMLVDMRRQLSLPPAG
jgi:AcrR family transcriptional regulator